jgi:hypothetical protein
LYLRLVIGPLPGFLQVSVASAPQFEHPPDRCVYPRAVRR